MFRPAATPLSLGSMSAGKSLCFSAYNTHRQVAIRMHCRELGFRGFRGFRLRTGVKREASSVCIPVQVLDSMRRAVHSFAIFLSLFMSAAIKCFRSSLTVFITASRRACFTRKSISAPPAYVFQVPSGSFTGFAGQIRKY
ncbi:hypothetical protein PILCRDRAFT_564133 [Piloderma croceum F 1598]|uniref:Uncharacterized protein n=1 Tax=Piloderma croceum (strain F 1598) TaxID=765440 RepID=A0A0C3FI69_PILCF|nr:hypothetical protein PILCRDRAFT_564133 [Piloderma croceum F 1598]